MALQSNVDQFLRTVRDTVYNSMAKTAHEAGEDVRTEISDLYPPASEPGTPPHVRTGNLLEGVSDRTDYDGQTAIVSTITSEREAGDPMIPTWLEGGTEKIAPRPYMSPAYLKWAPIFRANVAEALKSL